MDTVRSTRSTGTAHHTPEADADRNRLRTAIESAMASAASAVFDAVAASSSSPAAAVQSSSPSSSSTTMTASAGQSSRVCLFNIFGLFKEGTSLMNMFYSHGNIYVIYRGIVCIIFCVFKFYFLLIS